MKLLKTSVLALAILGMNSLSSFAQSAEELIQKHIAAIGGAENWKKITSIKMDGAVTAQGMEIPVTRTVLNGKGMRMDLTIMGMANYMILTDKEGWAYFPIQGQTKAEPLTADRVRESQDQLDVQGDFIDYQAKGSKIEYVGKDDVEGTESFKLKLTTKNGQEKLLYLDASNYYLIREVQKMKADGKEMDVTVSYSNYQKLPEGIVMAMSIESPEGPVTFKTIEVNPKIEEAIFKPTN